MKKERLLCVACTFFAGISFVCTVTGAPISIGPYTFSGPESFPDDATYVSGQTVYIEHPPGTSYNFISGNSTTDLDAALTGYDLTFGVGGEGIVVDLAFGRASILNGPGDDLVVFETSSAENFDLSIYIGGSLTGNLTYESVSTGLTVGDVVGSTNTAILNAVGIDLSDFGVGLGETVSKIRLYTQPVGIPPEDSTAGADIVAIGALHVVAPPSVWLQVTGTAQGGSVFFSVADVALSVTSTAGLNSEEVIQAMADAVNNDATLSSMCVTALAVDNTMYVKAKLTNIWSTDPGLIVIMGFGESPVDGDINLDGEVNAADILLGTQTLNNTATLLPEQLIHGDVAPLACDRPEPDGLFTLADLLVIERKALGLIDF